MLPAYASHESQVRYRHAKNIVEQCPEEFFLEIALTGSAARGLSNPESDFEINFWVERIPRVDLRLRWLQSIGVENLQLGSHRRDGSQWISGIYAGIALEAGWQTLGDVENLLHALLHAETTNHKDLRLGELFLSAKWLRGDEGILATWQEVLSHYPEALREKLIAEVLQAWLSEEFIDKENLVRLVFAINKQWEMNRKWTHTVELPLAPRDFFPRLASIHADDTEALQTLLLEAVLLLPEGYPLRQELIARFDFH